MNKYIKLALVLAIVSLPSASFAQYYNSYDNSYQISQMQAQLDALRAQLASLGYNSTYNTYPYNTSYNTGYNYNSNYSYPYNYGSTGNVLGATYYGNYGSQYGINSCNFTVNLALGSSHPQVADLNRMLGTGSATYFDQATYAAVVNFQNMYASEILAPAGISYANGYVGPLTRAKLNALCNGITSNTSVYGYGNVLGASTYNPNYYGSSYTYPYNYNYNTGYNYNNTYTGGTYYTGVPTLNLYVSNQNVNYNDTVTLNWNTTNASYCTASGAWTGNKNVNGSESRSNITYANTFTITCYGNGGSSPVTKSVTVTPYNYNNNQSGTPTINFYANPANVYGGGSTTLYWTVNNSNICTASGSWSGTKGNSGNEVVYNITNTRTYTLSCTSSTNQTTSQSVTVGVL